MVKISTSLNYRFLDISSVSDCPVLVTSLKKLTHIKHTSAFIKATGESHFLSAAHARRWICRGSLKALVWTHRSLLPFRCSLKSCGAFMCISESIFAINSPLHTEKYKNLCIMMWLLYIIKTCKSLLCWRKYHFILVHQSAVSCLVLRSWFIFRNFNKKKRDNIKPLKDKMTFAAWRLFCSRSEGLFFFSKSTTFQ